MQDLYIEVAGCRVRYRDSGSGKHPLLFIHGIGESLEFWMHQEPLAGDSYRIITLDLPGHGLSASGEQPYDPAKFAAFCWTFLDALDIDKVCVVGNSMGGGIAILMAENKPSRVEKLILANAATLGRFSPLPFRLMTLPILGEMMTRPSKLGVDQQLKSVFYSPDVVTEELRTVVTRNVMDIARAQAFLATLRQMTDLGGQKISVAHTALSALKKFRQPVLFLHGRQDTVIPFKHSVDAEQLTQNTKLVIFENCGHTPQFEHPGLFNDELTRFLNT